jgi:hypothetical protein
VDGIERPAPNCIDLEYLCILANWATRTQSKGCVLSSPKFGLVPSDGVFGRFDIAALRGCHTLPFVCLFDGAA